jgi:hypothetical protein
MAMKQKEEIKEESLLRQLCGADEKIYDCLTNYLYEDPSTAISEKELDILIEEADKNGKFAPALDKAIFKASQNSGERDGYLKTIQTLASKSSHATTQEKEKAEKEGLTDRVALLEKRIENQQLLNDRTADMLDVAEKFYDERLAVGKADGIRDARAKERSMAERQQMKIDDQERAKLRARLNEIKKMGRKERKVALKQYKADELAAEAAKEVREKEKQKSEKEESRLGEVEKTAREERKKDRS